MAVRGRRFLAHHTWHEVTFDQQRGRHSDEAARRNIVGESNGLRGTRLHEGKSNEAGGGDEIEIEAMFISLKTDRSGRTEFGA